MRFIILLIVSISFCPNFGYAAKKVLLSSMQTLTLHSDKFTTGRRSSPIPQLRCVDGRNKCTSLPSAVQCYNMGSDGIDVQWKCEAQLPKNVQFDSLQVQCEGYDYPDDPHVLAGSCGLTYSLQPAGAASSSHKHRQHSSSKSRSSYGADKESSDGSGYSPLVVVIGLLATGYVIYLLCLAPAAARNSSSTPSAPPPPYGGRADANDDAPPPYSEGGPGAPQYGFRSEYTGGGNKTYGGGAAAGGTAGPQPEATGAGRPGFWTGAALGGVAGYLFGGAGGGGNSNYYGNARQGWDSPRCHGSGGGSYQRDASYSSSSSSAASEESPVTRTGYASTRRR